MEKRLDASCFSIVAQAEVIHKGLVLAVSVALPNLQLMYVRKRLPLRTAIFSIAQLSPPSTIAHLRRLSTMKPIKLYTNSTPNGYKVSNFLEELKEVYGTKTGFDYDVHRIHFDENEQKSECE